MKKKVTINLNRIEYNISMTIGVLLLGDTAIKILEDAVRSNNVKIKHQTAIPEGLYRITVAHSPKFKKLLPTILDIPNFSGVRMHVGKTDKHTSGCPLTSTTFDLEAIIKYILAEEEKGNEVWIRVSNNDYYEL